MSVNKGLKKALIIGSGPIIIGQAAEFDYAGTQACKAIREEGIETILVNSNPATIMTDQGIADKVYMEPLTEEALEAILERERPDGILAGFGGQTGLNLAMALEESGALARLGVRLLGVNKDSIRRAEDREAFKELMLEIDEPVPESAIAINIEQCKEFVDKVGYPVIIRPAYTLGGTGGGIAEDEAELELLARRGMENSAIGQILLERSVAGWKEIEYEVIRDAKDNCIIVCGMENFDPVGVHTGDSIVVAPIQTLRDEEYQKLRDASLKIIRSLKIEGGCNIQFAMDPKSSDYVVIEVNPRVSRSSALASKAAGYPIAKIAAKIALGYSLDELKNYVTQRTSACFEPTLDYIVVKFPKWPFDKFNTASRRLGTQMKATGEVMSISRTFEDALLKAVTSLEVKQTGLRVEAFKSLDKDAIMRKIDACDDERIFALTEALRRGVTVEELHDHTLVDNWFLHKLENIVKMERKLESHKKEITPDMVREAEEMGFVDDEILELTGLSSTELHFIRRYNGIYPVYKMVDTCGGEFEAVTPYYYSCFDREDESRVSDKEKILVIGSGPIRIGQGIEFDYCCVQGVWAIKDFGYEAIIVNNNPETVSTDFDTSDKLYFEALHIDDVLNVIDKERPLGVVLQLGGQTSLNIAEGLSKRGIRILGTPFKSIDLAEDREKLRNLMGEMGIPTPAGFSVTDEKEAFEVVEKLGYPLVVRPSYVIGGRAMQVVYSDAELRKYLKEAVNLSLEHPVLIDQYVLGKEMDVDAVADGDDILIPGLMEHIERTGVHSGDSISVYPLHSISNEVADLLIEYTRRIIRRLGVVGLINVQYAWDDKKLYVIEVNPRASRTVPILSKVTGVPMVKLAVSAMLGKKLSESEYGVGLYRKMKLHAVKAPVFSGAKLTDVDVALGPEMKSTGEVLGIDRDYGKAVYKGFLASGVRIPESGGFFVGLRGPDRTPDTAEILREYVDEGFKLYVSPGTAPFMRESKVEADTMTFDEVLASVGERINGIINVPEVANLPGSNSFDIRRKAIERDLPVLTCMDTAKVFLEAIRHKKAGTKLEYRTLEEYLGGK
ncbi:MAG: carbamoyl-phosphate synthase (glutamine-hydrolyzing) large subunit [Clostridiales Family XIII bacterium]|jgi:carbamoyl-phosphate synthase large subunit|nr:carbamoyl-phosphate synthase (glutamine-hydrolyzing) large subunit [Clostridiales Family XIII bacterium]